MNHRLSRRRLQIPRAGLRAAALGSVLLALGSPVVAAEFPQLSAGFGSGLGGLFHREHIGGAPRSAEVGRFSAGAAWMDVGYLFRSHLTVGLRLHYLRVPVEDGGLIGKVDLLPGTLFFGYRQGTRTNRLRGFATAGVGVASARFLPSDRIELWEDPDGGKIEMSARQPLVFELSVGADVSLSEDFSLELGLLSVFMDTQLSFQPATSGNDGGYEVERAYDVEGRHLVVTAGLRWWVELW